MFEFAFYSEHIFKSRLEGVSFYGNLLLFMDKSYRFDWICEVRHSLSWVGRQSSKTLVLAALLKLLIDFLSYALIKDYLDSCVQLHGWTVECKLTIETLEWAVLKQLLSTNWLNKSAVKREVSLVSFRNFGFCLVRTNDMTCVSPYPDRLSSNGMRVAIFSFVFVHHCCFWWKGISLTTWMVVGETDKWNTNFKFFFAIFVHHFEWELVETVFCCFDVSK